MREPQQDVAKLQFTVQKRAIIYARVSTDEQAETGTSIEAQIEKSKAYAKSQGIPIVGIFADDYTGTTLDRPELNKARAMLKGGQADVLICFKTDRLDRSEWGVNLLILLQEIKSCGVELHYSENGSRVDLSSPQEMLLESIKGWQSGEERNTIVKRLTNGKIDRAKQGGVLVFGRPPYGYKTIKTGKITGLEIVENEADVVRLIYRWYVFGDESGQTLSIYAITRRLDEMNIPSPADTKTRPQGNPKKRKVGAWCKSTIIRIITSETYAGIWYYRKTTRKNGTLHRNENESIAVDVPAIIDRQLWDLAQKKRQENKITAIRNSKYEYLMAKRLTCGCCGYKINAKPTFDQYGRRYFYYLCPSKNYYLSRNCDMPYFPVAAVDKTIWNWVKELFEDEKRLEAAINRYRERREGETSPLRDELKTIEAVIKQSEKELAQAQKDFRAMKDSTAKRTKAALLRDIEFIENVLDGQEKQRSVVVNSLEQAAMTEAELQPIRDYAAEVRAGLDIANASFEEKSWLIKKLDVRASLTVEDGQKIAYVECRLGEKPERLEVASCTYLRTGHNLQEIVITARLVIG